MRLSLVTGIAPRPCLYPGQYPLPSAAPRQGQSAGPAVTPGADSHRNGRAHQSPATQLPLGIDHLAAEAELAAEAKLAAETERAELTDRWGLDRWNSRGPEQEQPRRWSARQPEHVHLAEVEERRYLDMPVARSEAEQTYRAALARARAEKRARRRS